MVLASQSAPDRSGSTESGTYLCPFYSRNVHSQIHHFVNNTVKVKSPSSAKRTDLGTIISVKDLIHTRCPRLYRWFCHTIHPAAIFDLMRRDGIIYQVEHLPF